MSNSLLEISREEWLKKVKLDWKNLKGCPYQDDEIVYHAILQNSSAIQYVLEQREDLCWLALRMDIKCLEHIKNPTSIMAMFHCFGLENPKYFSHTLIEDKIKKYVSDYMDLSNPRKSSTQLQNDMMALYDDKPRVFSINQSASCSSNNNSKDSGSKDNSPKDNNSKDSKQTSLCLSDAESEESDESIENVVVNPKTDKDTIPVEFIEDNTIVVVNLSRDSYEEYMIDMQEEIENSKYNNYEILKNQGIDRKELKYVRSQIVRNSSGKYEFVDTFHVSRLNINIKLSRLSRSISRNEYKSVRFNNNPTYISSSESRSATRTSDFVRETERDDMIRMQMIRNREKEEEDIRLAIELSLKENEKQNEKLANTRLKDNKKSNNDDDDDDN